MQCSPAGLPPGAAGTWQPTCYLALTQLPACNCNRRRGTESGVADITSESPVAIVQGGGRIVPINNLLFPVLDS